MRQQLVATIEEILAKDKRLVLLLGDIGVWGFRQAFKDYPDRVFNIGILEQATVSLAAGLAKTGLIPVFHTIAPFIAERALEQLKIDFGYQKLGGNFISVGGSYDYMALGCTHHCPADIGTLKQIPGMEIVIPGTPLEFDRLFKQSYADGRPSYFRLSERSNRKSCSVNFGQAKVIKKGKKATVLAIGPMLDWVLEASQGLDVSVLYYTTVAPFDAKTLKQQTLSNKIMICEPYYEGGLTAEIMRTFFPKPISIDDLGVPRQFITDYGTRDQQDKKLGLTAENVNKRIIKLIYG